MRGELYPDRNGAHRQMGPLDSCDTCSGRGWYDTEEGEKYCDCPCGELRKDIE